MARPAGPLCCQYQHIVSCVSQEVLQPVLLMQNILAAGESVDHSTVLQLRLGFIPGCR